MPEPPTIGHQVNFGKSLVGLIKQGFWEIPAVMCSTIMGFIGIGMGLYGLHKYNKDNGESREYKNIYTIMRPEDHRVGRLRNPVYTQY
ncbi:unnamed protein product [Colias eurytheme]|nr:unnamed protein product [Colias eurytheme]